MKIRTLSYAVLAILILVGVSVSTHPSVASTPAQATAQATVDASTSALIRVINASPDAPAIDVYLDKASTPMVSNLAYAYGTDGYRVIAAGKHHLTITAAGDTKTVIYDDDDDYAAGSANTVLLQGLASTKSRLIRFLLDDVSDTGGKARIKVSNSITDGPSIDLVTADFKTTLVSDVTYGNTAFATADAGTYDLLVVPHGSTDASTALANATGLQLSADQIYTILTIGTAKGDTPIKPLLFITSPVAGFQPPVFPTPAATASQ